MTPHEKFTVTVAQSHDLTGVLGCGNLTVSIKNGTGESSYKFFLSVLKYPTQNCQLTSLGPLATLLSRTTVPDEVLFVLRQCYALLGFQALLVLVDVKQSFCEAVEKCFQVVVKTPYVSTNGSLMCLYVVKLEKPVQAIVPVVELPGNATV